MTKRFTYALLIGVFSTPAGALANDTDSPLGNLGDMPIQSLGDVVTSVSKKPEDSFRSAAAVYVITNEEIKLSGATHIAEVLRGVPGLDVARFDSSNWAISSRGLNGFYANELLVLVDGRTIYTPLFSGVYWDIQNMPLDDIERIEVIRGPGASLWGANAVNGVINIITKRAADTQGTYINQIAGNQDRSLTDVRYGGKIADDLYYRAYAKNDDRAAMPTVNGTSGNNQWDNAKAGFRADWDTSSSRKITLQGDVYDASINLTSTIPSLTAPTGFDTFADMIHSKGFNVLGRWDEKHNQDLSSTFQAYVDYQSPSYSQLQQEIYTFDLDYQTTWKANDRNDIEWGLGTRYIADNLTGSRSITISNYPDNESIFSAFIQDQYALVHKEVYLTIGSKVEHNSFTGYEVEPSARIAWYPDNKQTMWAAISRAVRTPGIGEMGVITNNITSLAPGAVAQTQFNANSESEELIAYELGYRVKPTQQVSIDSTAFINDYTKLTTYEPGTPIVTPDGVYYPYNAANLGAGHAYGFETSAKWEVSSRWNLLANYSYINLLLDQGASQDPTFQSKAGEVPHHQFMFRSQLFLPHDVQLVDAVYYVDRLPADSIDSYVRFDTQVLWQATSGIELALVGQNLLDNKHQEFTSPPAGTANEIPRAFYGRVTIRY
ncbi:MAG: TonB-dependent receptor plug domain-containing protein [Thermoguttaceae bacterium]